MTSNEVMVVRWPEDGDDGARFARHGVAVLYVIDAHGDPPAVTTCLEDWVRVPGDERDLRSRIAALEARSAVHLALPRVDPDGRLHYRGKLTLLPADKVDIARALVEHFGHVVPDAELPGEADELRPKIAQLRAQFRELELSVLRVRRKGYALHAQ